MVLKRPLSLPRFWTLVLSEAKPTALQLHDVTFARKWSATRLHLVNWKEGTSWKKKHHDPAGEG